MLVEDLYYGAVAVAQRLEELKPERLILVGAESRGLPPGTVSRRAIEPASSDNAQEAVEQAVTGYVSIELVLSVAFALGALPRRTLVIEVEPQSVEPSENISAAASYALNEVVDLVRLEAQRTPVLTLAHKIEKLVEQKAAFDSEAQHHLGQLLGELNILERQGRWGRAFALRDKLVGNITDGRTGDAMSKLDWVLWWSLIEELNRLEQLEATAT